MTLTRKQARFAKKMQSEFPGEAFKEPVQYYLIAGGSNVVRELGVMLSYLEHETGEWVQSNTLFPTITFEASTKEITEHEAQRWVAKRLPRLSVKWI